MARLPVSMLFRDNNSTDAFINGANQIASVFFRVAPPAGGVEVYGEFYREDHSGNSRDLLVEPDHSSAYVLGLRRVWSRRDGFGAITIERANARITHLLRVRSQGPVYAHEGLTEGHTYLGQILGSSALFGGSGLICAVDDIRSHRARQFAVELRAQAQSGEGGMFDAADVGTVAFRFSETRETPQGLAGIGVELERGYGVFARTNLMLFTSLRPKLRWR